MTLSKEEQELIINALAYYRHTQSSLAVYDASNALIRRFGTNDPANDGPEVAILSVEAHYARTHGISLEEAARRLHSTTTRE